MRWDSSAETLRFIDDAEEIERLTQSVKRFEHDASLGPYPLATEGQWRDLSGYVSEVVLQRAGIQLGTYIVPGGIDEDVDDEIEKAKAALSGTASAAAPGSQSTSAAQPAVPAKKLHLQPFFDDAPRVATFVELDARRRHDGGRTGAALSRFHLDKTEWLIQLLLHDYGGGEGSGEQAQAEAAFLGELQLAFLLFLRLSSLRALEHWKHAVSLLCSCEAALQAYPALYAQFLPILRAQLTLAPADFFEDALSEDNFLRDAFAQLAEAADGQSLAAPVETELGYFWGFLSKQFGISLEALRAAAMDDDDEPVVVAMP